MKISAKRELKNGLVYTAVGGLAGGMAAKARYINLPTKYSLLIPQGDSYVSKITDSFINYAKENIDFDKVADFAKSQSNNLPADKFIKIAAKEAAELLPDERNFYQNLYDLGHQYLSGKEQVGNDLLATARESARVIKGALKKEKFDFMKNHIIKGAIGVLAAGEAISLGVKFVKRHPDFFKKPSLKKNSKLTQKNV